MCTWSSSPRVTYRSKWVFVETLRHVQKRLRIFSEVEVVRYSDKNSHIGSEEISVHLVRRVGPRVDGVTVDESNYD